MVACAVSRARDIPGWFLFEATAEEGVAAM
jgi:hypothetical protein